MPHRFPRPATAGCTARIWKPYGPQPATGEPAITKRGKETGIAILCMKLCGIIYKALLYSVPEITGMKCGKKQRKQGIINFLSVNSKCL